MINLDFDEEAFWKGVSTTVPGVSGYEGTKIIEVIRTGEVDYYDEDYSEPEFWLGVAVGGRVGWYVGSHAYATANSLSWFAFSRLAFYTMPLLVLYESARLTQGAFDNVGHSIGAGSYWSSIGDVGSGGSMPIVTGGSSGNMFPGLEEYFGSVSYTIQEQSRQQRVYSQRAADRERYG